jgi:hypothetical protein
VTQLRPKSIHCDRQFVATSKCRYIHILAGLECLFFRADTAHTATKSLDLLRQIVQDDITKELKEVVERHVELTFAPAIENIKRNRVDVTEEHVHTLCRSILEAAKSAFVSPIAVRDEFASPEPPPGASYLANKVITHRFDECYICFSFSGCTPNFVGFTIAKKMLIRTRKAMSVTAAVDVDEKCVVLLLSIRALFLQRVLPRADFGSSSPARSSTPLGVANTPGAVTAVEVQKVGRQSSPSLVLRRFSGTPIECPRVRASFWAPRRTNVWE